MRTIDECRAEVLRRMEIGIRERKRKRNRVIAVCAPLCLFTVICSVMLLPAMLSASGSHDGVKTEMAADRTEGGPQILFTSAEIVNSSCSAEKTAVSTDTEQVDMLYKSILKLFDRTSVEAYDGATVPEGMDEEAATEDSSLNVDTAHSKYTITFCSSHGDRIVYEISGNSLTCKTAYDETVLTQGELMELIRKLTSLFDGKETAE